jgi:Fe-S cluster assembly scaffold protein SufB
LIWKWRAALVRKIRLTEDGNYRYLLDKPGQEIEVVGRFQVRGKERLEVLVEIVHIAENTRAKVSLKATVDEVAQVFVKGNVIVEKLAKNTESFLEERVLLLSDGAKAEAVPDLEIKNNEVKCSHAATVGKIDEEQIFYLNARGIGEIEAKKIIAEGFLK